MSLPYFMIVEDQALIGMSLEAYLEEAGFKVAGTFTSNAEALRWLEHNTPEVALLDVALNNGMSVLVARELKGRGMPFAIYSGVRLTADLTAELQGAPWLEKPVSREALTQTLAQLTGTRT